MRCLALAQGWRQAGGDVVFAMAEATPALEQRLAEENCRIARVSAAPGSREDLKATRTLMAAESPSWFALDGYRFDAAYREAIGEAGPKCLLVDDNGGQDCFEPDLVLNQNVHATADLYSRRARHTRLLLGPRYALLRKEFAEYCDYVREIPENGKKILVTMGGSDPNDLTPRILPHLGERLGKDVQVRVVVGGDAGHARAVESQASAFQGRVQVLRDVRNMAELMGWADLAIAAAGTTCWEMCCLGLPAIVVEAADNQRPIARKLDTMGVAVNAGPVQLVDCAELAERAHEMLRDQQRRSQMSLRARRLVDGRGAGRVLIFMNSDLRVRLAEARDCRLLWEWANDVVARSASFSESPISWESHQQWFKQQMGSAAARIYIAENKAAEPVGQVRYQIEAARATLSINLAPKLRGQGLGSKVLLLGIEELFNTTSVETIDAYVKPANAHSLELFRSAGFEEASGSEVCGQHAVRFVLKRWGAGE